MLRELVVHLRARGPEIDVLEDVADRPADVYAHRVRRDPGRLERVAVLGEVGPGLRRLDSRLLEIGDVVPDGRFVGALEHHGVLLAVHLAGLGDVLSEGVHDLALQIVDRLDRTLLREVGHEPGLTKGCDVRRLAALHRGREQRREVVAPGRVLDVHVRVLLLEPVDHGLERRLLLAGPDRHHRERTADVLVAAGVAVVVAVAASAGGRSECQRDGQRGEE